MTESVRIMHCPECGRVSSIAPWCKRPICLHSWEGNTPEIWDGDDIMGDGRTIEQSSNPDYRTPGANTWTEMQSLPSATETKA